MHRVDTHVSFLFLSKNLAITLVLFLEPQALCTTSCLMQGLCTSLIGPKPYEIDLRKREYVVLSVIN